jgi:hypothetical protein
MRYSITSIISGRHVFLTGSFFLILSDRPGGDIIQYGVHVSGVWSYCAMRSHGSWSTFLSHFPIVTICCGASMVVEFSIGPVRRCWIPHWLEKCGIPQIAELISTYGDLLIASRHHFFPPSLAHSDTDNAQWGTFIMFRPLRQKTNSCPFSSNKSGYN